MCFLWCYDIIKYVVFKGLLENRGIDPLVFLFLDMITVPGFIVGCARLVNSLSGRVMAWPKVLFWGILVLVNTLFPYVYAVLAGGPQFDTAAWVVFWTLILLMLANLIRTIRAGLIAEKQ
ncbi:hypothetical protein DO021_18400 [Desulfobacter hydrogenophilus]|uniref:Uncharacterized protein n=2 Tax=Desulfobacter hydrogenophilus TaxID=2291 RepID=A0A328FBT1_9BACT|nr:hypothetical protein [Desulfobacter hydrogenophilus]QBH15491.1 hypothetical protein EYB58_01820 [Desulfobacter hydrogenophilus]RAM00573.1 hypothetical protein DO021_18400 [Desulfobacter hydrogenophilus]